MRLLRAGLAAFVLALVGLLGVSWPAAADTSAPIDTYRINAELSTDGVAHVTINMRMDFSQQSGHGPIFVFPERQADGKNPDEWFSFPISNIKVTSPTGARTDTNIEREQGNVAVRVGAENTVYNQPEDYVITYDVKGLIVSDQPQSGLDEFSWNAIGAGSTSRIADAEVTVTGPANVERTACFYGPSFDQKCSATSSGDTATFAIGPVPPNTPVQVVAGFPAGTFGGVQQIKIRRVTPSNMFELTPATGAATGVLGIGAIIALVVINRRNARDDVFLGLTPGLTPAKDEQGRIGKKRGKFNVAVAFRPPKDARPGEIGTLLDTTADSIDISATLVDLAVRGFLTIQGTDERGSDHVLTRSQKRDDGLEPYEQLLLRKIFDDSDQKLVSELKDAKYAGVQKDVKSALYQQVVDRRWFKRNPNTAQLMPVMLGGVGLLVAFLLGAWLVNFGWGLVAIPFAVLGLGLIVMSKSFRTRTARGSAVLAETKGFELYLRTAEADQIKFEEGIDVFSRYLPYAMIFGVAERWAKVFAELGAMGRYEPDLSWYYGANLYNSFLFSSALGNLSHGFSQAMSQAVSASMREGIQSATGSSSGFSGFGGGGGFSGGGGSVGSW